LANAVTGKPQHGGGGRLRVTVLDARNLARKDIASKSDPYVILSIHSKLDFSMFGEKQQTTVINNNQNPYWNQTFTLSVRNPQNDLLKVRVYDKDTLRDDEIGSVEIPLFDLVNGQPKDGWHQLYPASGGAIHLVLVAEGFGGQAGPYPPQQSGGYPQSYPQQSAGYPQQGYPQQSYPQQGYQQPTVMVQTTMPPQYTPPTTNGRQPQQFRCPVCNKDQVSNVTYQMGTGSWVWFVVFLIVFFPISCCSCCVNDCQDAVHTCPQCGREAGRNKFCGI